MDFHVCHIYEIGLLPSSQDNLVNRPSTFNVVTQLLFILAAVKSSLNFEQSNVFTTSATTAFKTLFSTSNNVISVRPV